MRVAKVREVFLFEEANLSRAYRDELYRRIVGGKVPQKIRTGSRAYANVRRERAVVDYKK